MARTAASMFRREFELSLGEWRALALLGVDAPLSLTDLARAAALDRAQMSRVVTGLIGRGLISRQLSLRGGKMVKLTLTRAGTRVYTGLIEAARERDAMFRASLAPGEIGVLESALARLTEQARQLMHDEPETEN